MKTKPIIGILGGIGSGKSTVAQLFTRHGGGIIVADRMAHHILDRAAVREQICARFGEEILNEQGFIDRPGLGRKVFDTPEDLQYLNDIIHPYVLAECTEQIQTFNADDSIQCIVLDMPLLLEVGWDKRCDYLIFVECRDEQRLDRALKNGKLDENQLKKREKFQISLDKKRRMAHYIVNNNSDLSDAAEQIAQIFSDITKSK